MTDKYPPRTPEQESQYQAYLAAKVEYDKREKLRNAAPDLLEALKDARFYLYGSGPGNPKIDAAIARAEGKTK